MVEKIAGAVAPAAPTPGAAGGANFEQALKGVGKAHRPGASFPSPAETRAPPTPQGPQGASPATAPQRSSPSPRGIRNAPVEPGARLDAGPARTERPGAPAILDEVQRAQARLDQLLKMAESGRSFTPAELLAFQTHAYRASQELDLAGKVVEKGTSAVKQTLQTQI